MNADPRHPSRNERCELAALLERAYRLALWLHDAERVDRVETPRDSGESPASFAVHVASSELVDVLDEARARLVAGAGGSIGSTFSPAGTPTPTRSSAPPDR